MKRSIGAKTLVYPTPTWIVGSYDAQGKPNDMVAAWGGNCSAPPCVAVSLRKATYSYSSQIEQMAFIPEGSEKPCRIDRKSQPPQFNSASAVMYG